MPAIPQGREIWTLVLAALALCFCIGPAQARERQFNELASPGYRVITHASVSKGEKYIEAVNRFKQVLEVSLQRKVRPSTLETRIYVLPSKDWRDYLQPHPNTVGIFFSGRFANYIVLDGGMNYEQALEGIYHEYTHYFLDSQFVANYPAWFHEGFASLMETVRFQGSKVRLGINRERIAGVRSGEWIPFERMMSVRSDSPEYSGHRMAEMFYGESWAIVHYAMCADPKLGAKLIDYASMYDHHRKAPKDAEKVLGMSFAQVDERIRQHVKRDALEEAVFELPAAVKPAVDGVQKLSEADSALMLLELALEAPRQPLKPTVLLDEIKKARPDDVRVIAMNGLWAARLDNDDDADACIARAAPLLQPKDVQAAKILGFILLDRMQSQGVARRPTAEQRATLQRAHEFYAMAFKAAPDDIEAAWGFGLSRVYANEDIGKAVEVLEAAYKKDPYSDHLAYALAFGYERLNNSAAAQRYWTDTHKYARHTHLRVLAKRVLAAYDGEEESKPADAGAGAKN